MRRREGAVKYLVIYTQDGEGCDYSIGCGVLIEEIEAVDLDDAEQQIRVSLFDSGGMEHSECRMKSVLFVQANLLSTFDVARWREASEAADCQKEQHAIEQAERAEFARLKRKFQL